MSNQVELVARLLSDRVGPAISAGRAVAIARAIVEALDTDEDADEDVKWMFARADYFAKRVSAPKTAERYRRIANRLASSTPAEPDEPTEAMIEAGGIEFGRRHADCCYPQALDVEANLAAEAIYRAMSQRKAEPDGGEA